MTRNVIGRAERHKTKIATAKTAEVISPNSDIDIISASTQPYHQQQPQTSILQQKKDKEQEHRRRSLEYYHQNKDKVLARIKAKRLEKSQEKTKAKLKNIDKKIEAADDKKISGSNEQK